MQAVPPMGEQPSHEDVAAAQISSTIRAVRQKSMEAYEDDSDLVLTPPPQIEKKKENEVPGHTTSHGEKTLHNSNVSGAKQNVPDIVVFGDGDLFQLISKASSEHEGWMKSTKAMEIKDLGCVVQVTTQQRNLNGSYSVAEAVTFVPGVKVIKDMTSGLPKLVKI